MSGTRPAATVGIRRPALVAALVAGAAFVWGVLNLHRYGVTFDSPSLFYAGDRTLFFLEHPSAPFALDFMAQVEPPGFHSHFVLSPEISDPVRLPAFPGVVCAITDAIFHGWLHWTGSVDGHHLGLVLLHAIGLFAYVIYGHRLFGLRNAVLAATILALFPCALGHSFSNAKDWPAALFYGVTVLAAGAAIVEGSAKRLLGAAVWLGVALAAKFNPVFVVITLALWAPVVVRLKYRSARNVPDAMILAALAMPLIGAGIFFLSWPWLYHGPVKDWPLNIVEYLTYMLGHGTTGSHVPSSYPLRCVLFTTPPLVLVAAVVYAVRGWRAEPREKMVWALLLLWTGLPILRVTMPGAGFYDGNRHYIEYVPGLSALAGAGVGQGLDALGRLRVARPGIASAAALLVLAAALVWPVAATHPYETTYFNVLAGGLGGAQRAGVLHAEKPLDRASGVEGDYWYSSLRDAMNLMRGELRPGQTFSACGPWPAQVLANWELSEPPPYVGNPRGHIEKETLSADLLYAAPREGPSCSWSRIREFERTRPVVWRVTRDGGLVYEVFGRPYEGERRPAVSPPNRYDPSPADAPPPPQEPSP